MKTQFKAAQETPYESNKKVKIKLLKRKSPLVPPINGMPIAKKPKEQIIMEEKTNKPDNMESNLSKNDTTKRATALYCNTYIDRVKILLIIDFGSAGCIISLKLLKDLDMEKHKHRKLL
ncbi:14298_t:CDS:2 [Funneliformis geosporum]|uniref:14298_t:CDS:1 n=1 Tax=Funneliformis geosporum TaxID=1117311 RepID=A0A9W4SN11_9GLOM|nr:14298_t:CDS:2 [Funneliformis geosporum]